MKIKVAQELGKSCCISAIKSAMVRAEKENSPGLLQSGTLAGKGTNPVFAESPQCEGNEAPRVVQQELGVAHSTDDSGESEIKETRSREGAHTRQRIDGGKDGWDIETR